MSTGRSSQAEPETGSQSTQSLTQHNLTIEHSSIQQLLQQKSHPSAVPENETP